MGIRQGATENATVVGELLGDLVDRGLDFTEPRLYVLDGGKALSCGGEKTRRRVGSDPALPGPYRGPRPALTRGVERPLPGKSLRAR